MATNPIAAPAWLVAYGDFVFRYRNTLFPLVLVALFVVLPPDLNDSEGLRLGPVNAGGIVLALLGQAIRVAVVGLAYITRGGVDKKVYADSLVTEGIFRHCRNPLYVGNILILVGLFVIHDNSWAYLLGGVFFGLSYIAVVSAEERYLYDKFREEYLDYCRRTPRWLLKLTGLIDTFGSMRFKWRRVVAKEYPSMTSWVLFACLLLLYERLLVHGAGIETNHVMVPTALGLGAVFASVVIKSLKKAGHLRG